MGTPYLDDISKYPFVLCVRGGGRGQDPNPFAWSALLAGSIPIIQRFPGDSIYDGLPVVRLDDLPSAQLTPANLRRWRAKRGAGVARLFPFRAFLPFSEALRYR